MTAVSLPNPFETNKATDFTDQQIREYWVDLVGHGGLEQLLQPSTPTPMLILGSKGSGKTHLLRYSSHSVRRLGWGDSPLEGIRKDGYLGIYLSADGLNAGRFAGKGVPPDQWRALFRYYFESWVTQLLIEIADATKEAVNGSVSEVQTVEAILALFDRPPAFEGATFESLKTFFVNERRDIDFAINNAAFTNTLQITIRFTAGRLLFGVPELIATFFGLNSAIRFLYLIDELENFTDDQQRFVNTLIRYRKGRASFRIGARLYGIRTFQTDNTGEQNKEGAEYEVLRLDELIRDGENYHECARMLCAKRLVESGYLLPGDDIRSLATHLDDFFEEPAKDGLAELESRNLTEKYDGRERPYFAILRKQLEANARTVLGAEGADPIITGLACAQYPLLEKLNCLFLYQDWSRARNLYDSSAEIQEMTRIFLSEDEKPQRYVDKLRHFKSDLLAQLYRECKSRPVYAGIGTLVHMSGGVPRNLLGLLKHIFRRAVFAGESPFRRGKISVSAQQDGVRDAAGWFMDDAQPDQFGAEVRTSVSALGELFREIRFSNKPVECALSAFSVDRANLTKEADAVLRHAENWSFLLRIRGGEKHKNSKAVIDKFQLNPVLAPRWDLSVSRRGTYSLSGDLANALFDPSKRQEVASLIRVRVSAMNAPFPGGESEGQLLI
jgi:hypothetical protein